MRRTLTFEVEAVQFGGTKWMLISHPQLCFSCLSKWYDVPRKDAEYCLVASDRRPSDITDAYRVRHKRDWVACTEHQLRNGEWEWVEHPPEIVRDPRTRWVWLELVVA